MNKLIIGLAATATLIGGAAIAAHAADKSKGPAGWLLKHGDTNGDGAISRDEFLAKAAEHFAKADANKDGKVTGDEVMAMMAAHHGGRMRHGDHRGGPGGAAMMEGHEGPDGGMFARLDADGNGKVSLAEFNAPHDKHFAMVDANKDGEIDKTEMAAAMDKMRGHMRQMRGAGGPRDDMPPPPPPPGADGA